MISYKIWKSESKKIEKIEKNFRTLTLACSGWNQETSKPQPIDVLEQVQAVEDKQKLMNILLSISLSYKTEFTQKGSFMLCYCDLR